MTTIMTWETSGGKKGSCNGRCHNAKLPRCRCLCSGRFHGSAHQPGGVEQAVKDTWEDAIQEAEQKAKSEGMELDTSRLRKFVGLEPANHAIHATNHDSQGRPMLIKSAEGEAGEVTCPNCGASISFNSTSWKGLCANCGNRYPIVRPNPSIAVQGRLPLEVG